MQDQWYYASNGRRDGPVTREQLHQLAAAGRLRPTDFVWTLGLATWVAASAVEGLCPTAVPPPAAPVWTSFLAALVSASSAAHAAWWRLAPIQQVLLATGAGLLFLALAVGVACSGAFSGPYAAPPGPEPAPRAVSPANTAPAAAPAPASSLDPRFAGHWVYESYAAPIVAGDDVFDVSSHRYITIGNDGRFTDTTDSSAFGADPLSSTAGVSQGSEQGRVFPQGPDQLTFQYDSGRTWTAYATLKAWNGLELDGLLYIK